MGLVNDSDNSPCFRDGFKNRMKQLGVNSTTSLLYHSSRNGLAEAKVKQVKELLECNGLLNETDLKSYINKMNTMVSTIPVAGLPWTCFFHGEPHRKRIPSLMKDVSKIEVQEWMWQEMRHRKQSPGTRGRASREVLTPGDPVRVWCPKERNSAQKGTISKSQLSMIFQLLHSQSFLMMEERLLETPSSSST